LAASVRGDLSGARSGAAQRTAQRVAQRAADVGSRADVFASTVAEALVDELHAAVSGYARIRTILAALVAPLSTPHPVTGMKSAFPPWPPRDPGGAAAAASAELGPPPELAGAIESDLLLVETLLIRGGGLSLPPSVVAAAIEAARTARRAQYDDGGAVAATAVHLRPPAKPVVLTLTLTTGLQHAGAVSAAGARERGRREPPPPPGAELLPHIKLLQTGSSLMAPSEEAANAATEPRLSAAELGALREERARRASAAVAVARASGLHWSSSAHEVGLHAFGHQRQLNKAAAQLLARTVGGSLGGGSSASAPQLLLRSDHSPLGSSFLPAIRSPRKMQRPAPPLPPPQTPFLTVGGGSPFETANPAKRK